MESPKMKSTGNSCCKDRGLFPARLFKMLEMVEPEGLSNIISWDESGKQVIVKNRQALEESGLLQKYMLQNKYTSFNRQLQYYGFKRLDRPHVKNTQTVPIFMHTRFQRDRPDLHEDMETLRPPSNKNKTFPSSSNANNKRKTEQQVASAHNQELEEPKAKKAKSSKLQRERKRRLKTPKRNDSCISPSCAGTDYFDDMALLDFGIDNDYWHDDTKYKKTHSSGITGSLCRKKNTPEHSALFGTGVQLEQQQGCAHQFLRMESTCLPEKMQEESYNYDFYQKDPENMIMECDDVQDIANVFETIGKPLEVNHINEYLPHDDQGWADLRNMIVGI